MFWFLPLINNLVTIRISAIISSNTINILRDYILHYFEELLTMSLDIIHIIQIFNNSVRTFTILQVFTFFL